MIYVYAVADRPEQPLPRQLGLHDQGLAKVVCRDIVAVVSAYSGAPPAKTADELWRHEAVVESLMSDRAVLPMRFATLLPSRQHVGDMLCRAYRALARDIERVRGHVEIGMRFFSAIEPDGEAARPPAAADRFTLRGTGPGSAYLRARLAREQQLRDRQRAELRLVRDVYDLLASHAKESRLDGEAQERHGIAAAFLVPRDCLAAFRDCVGEVADANPQLALLATGPWPPYSFVGAGEQATSGSEERHGH